jgi:hypothetical protein
MLTFSSALEREFKKLVEEEMARVTEIVLAPSNPIDFATYRQLVGRVAGLARAIELIELAAEEVQKQS